MHAAGTNSRRTKKRNCGCQNKALPRRIHRHISGVFDDLKTLEVDPHRVSRIRQPTRCECVRCEKVAIFVIPVGKRNPKQWDERQPDGERRETHEAYSDTFAVGQSTEEGFQAVDEAIWVIVAST